MKVGFFDVVYHSDRNAMTWSDVLFETADSYFALLGTKKICVVTTLKKNELGVQNESAYPITKWNLAVKVASLFGLFLVPLAMLAIKFIGRKTRKFEVIDPTRDLHSTTPCNETGVETRKEKDPTSNPLQEREIIQLPQVQVDDREIEPAKTAEELQKEKEQQTAKKKLARATRVLQKHVRIQIARKRLQKAQIQRQEEVRIEKEAYQKLCQVTGSPSCGSKHDNLLMVRQSLMKGGEGLAAVPAFFGFTSEQVRRCLQKNTKKAWQKLKSELNPKNCQELQELVQRDVLKKLLFNPGQTQALLALKNRSLIVRSSSHEDGQVVNAGQNLTLGNIEATEEALKQAIAKVVSSYFGYPSLKNRAEFEKQKIFEKMPDCSVLVMEQIIETLTPPVSGVVMTHKPDWADLSSEGRMMQVSATYGFGEGVVSGSIPSDEWVITDTITYATIRKKTHRIQVLSGGKSQEAMNTSALQHQPVLDETMLKNLETVAKHLEKSFGYCLDIEFVVHNHQLYIVQARPIQAFKTDKDKVTYLDPETLPEGEHFFSTPILSGTGKVFSTKKERILFASTLEEAMYLFKKEDYDTVVVHTAPQASNSHAAVNFASYKPPIACFALSKGDWDAFKSVPDETACTICSQTGVVLRPAPGQKIAVQEGLFAHPISSPVSIDGQKKNVQALSVDPEVQEVERLLLATPKTLVSRLREVSEKIDAIFKKIVSSPPATKTMSETRLAMQSSIKKTIEAMQVSQEHSSHLAMHAKMLRQMLVQKDPTIVGGHSLAGLKSKRECPVPIQDFIETHCKDASILKELAFFGSQAFDEELQAKWLKFLQDNAPSKEGLVALHAFLEEVDAIRMIPLWLAFHFADQIADKTRVYIPPKIETLVPFKTTASTKEVVEDGQIVFLQRCAQFQERFAGLWAQTEKMDSEKSLKATWERVTKISEEFLAFASSQKTMDPFQQMCLQNALVLLINLWDLNIKKVLTSHLITHPTTEAVMGERIKAFAQFGLDCYTASWLGTKNDELQEVLRMMKAWSGPHVSRAFSGVEHWLVPRGGFCGGVHTQDQRLSVIHQNLLQVAQTGVSTSLLPASLQRAETIFKDTYRSMRIGAKYTSISEESAAIRINLPLRVHSCTVTIKQSKASKAPLAVSYYIRSADHDDSCYGDFFMMFCQFKEIPLPDIRPVNPNKKNDFEVVFSVKNDKEMALVSQAIDYVNQNTMNRSTEGIFEALVETICPEERRCKDEDNYDEYITRTELERKKIWVAIWDWFKKNKTWPDMITPRTMARNKYAKELLGSGENRDLIFTTLVRELQQKVEDTGQVQMPFIENYLLRFMWELATDVEKSALEKAIWENLCTKQTLKLHNMPPQIEQRFIVKLCKEQPLVALKYGQKGADHILTKPVQSLQKTMETSGESITSEHQQLFDAAAKSFRAPK